MLAALENLIQSKYLLEREMKSGEHGAVFLLRERDTGRRMVCHRFTGNGEVYELLRNVNCPYLPRVEQVAWQDGNVLVLEEYIQGDTLAFLLEERPLPEETARNILLQICRALQVLHALGVVHRDVKPENIILRGDRAVLIDFDASRVSKTGRNTDTQVMGTTGYAAPEQFGFSQTDARADIFSLGVLLNEMLTRQHPARELASGPLRAVIEKCIEVNVDKRYSSVEELLAALNMPVRVKRKTKLWKLLLAVAVLLAGVITLTRILPGEAPEMYEPETPGNVEVEKSPPQETKEPESTPEIPEISLQRTKVPWHGDSEVYGTEFRYDLDGDGEQEEYLFAAMFNFVDKPRLLQHSGTTIDDKPEVMEVVGAVWVETGEEIYEPVEEFAPLLSNASVNVRQIEGERDGVVEQIGSLYSIWPGAIRATFEYVGYWYYECSAVLNGETLNAVGSTRTELLSEAAASVAPYMTPFQYDLDGDGTVEEYWFEAVSQIENGAFPLFHDETGFSEGSGSERIVAPAVWRKISRDKYEQVQEFASLLENPQVTLRRLSGEVQPTVRNADGVFGPWKGAIQVVYSDEGIWVYEISAVLDGKKLTAAAVTETYFNLEE